MSSKKNLLPIMLLLGATTACSSKSEPSVTTPSTNTNTGSSYVAPVTPNPQVEVDAVSSATAVKAEQSYSEINEVIYKNPNMDSLLLENAPSFYDILFQALETTVLPNSTIPLEVIHNTMKESLGDSYQTVLENRNSLEIIEEYELSENLGISVIESIVSSSKEGNSDSLTETLASTEVSSKAARIYIPKVGTNEYFVVTLQEIVLDDDNIFTYTEVGTATISTFNTDMAKELLVKNISNINEQYQLDIAIPDFSQEDSTLDASENTEEDAEMDALSSASPAFHDVETENGLGQLVQVSVKHFPNKIAYLDYSAFDVALTVGIAGQYEQMLIQDQLPSVLAGGVNNAQDLTNSLANGDFSSIASFEPDIIFITREQAQHYDVLSKIAPVIVSDTGNSTSFENYIQNLNRMSTMYSIQYLIDAYVADYSQRLEALKPNTSEKTALVMIYKNGAFTAANSGFELLFDTLSMSNLGSNIEVSGDFSQLTPDFAFILDYDGTAPSLPFSSGTTISLDIPAWTLHSGGILGMEQMIQDLEQGIS